MIQFIKDVLLAALTPVADLLNSVLPDWVLLPDITFRMPHWIYWMTLIVFPLVAMALVKRDETRRDQNPIGAPTAYMLLIFGGFAGLHRFYLRSFRWGAMLVLLFVLVLYGNAQGGVARNAFSDANNAFKIVDFDVKRLEKRQKRGRSINTEKLETLKKKRTETVAKLEVARSQLVRWRKFSGFFAWAIAVLLIVDLLLVPGLIRRARALEADKPPPEEFQVMERGSAYDPRTDVRTPVTRFIDKISGWTGTFVAYWAVIAVFVYYFEVISRYVFNSPTNWVHEGMYLMFGMQYLIAGAYAYREDAHVRVDVIFERFSARNRAIIDLITSSVFFIFTGVLLVTGVVFASQAVDVMEKSFTEWEIEYWPAKIIIVVGAVLLLLQGIARLIRDVTYLRGLRRLRGVHPDDAPEHPPARGA